MREQSVSAAIATSFVAFFAMFSVTSLSAQQRQPAPTFQLDPRLNPDDQLAPSQVAQPMPAAVPEPGAAARHAKKPLAQHAATGTKPAPAKPPRPARFPTVVACSGAFAKDSGMLALAVAYGARNMIFKQENVQGTMVGITVLFPNDQRRRLEVWWANPNRTGTYLIDIAGKSIWTGPKGLRLGLTLPQLEKLNHKPFKLNGFDQDNAATVIDWDDGELETLPGGCKASVSLHASPKSGAATDLPAADQYNSDDPAMRAMKPTVSEILIGY